MADEFTLLWNKASSLAPSTAPADTGFNSGPNAGPITRPNTGLKAPTLLLAHGAGAPMDSEFMNTVAEGLAARQVNVARFEFDYMAKRRLDQGKRPPERQDKLLARFAAVAEQAGGLEKLFIGGKSMGGRMATYLAADEGLPWSAGKRCRGVVVLGYPLHPAGKPERLRVSHLGALSAPVLVCQGERDPLGTREEVEALVAQKAIGAAIQWCWLPDGNHDLKPRVRSGLSWQKNIDTALDHMAAWMYEL